jgi:virulence-associated protein VagC
MDTARLFQSGRSQAVRLPKAYRFEGTEVAVRHLGAYSTETRHLKSSQTRHP